MDSIPQKVFTSVLTNLTILKKEINEIFWINCQLLICNGRVVIAKFWNKVLTFLSSPCNETNTDNHAVVLPGSDLLQQHAGINVHPRINLSLGSIQH